MRQVEQHPYFYVFVRQDLGSLAQQLVQTNHATFEMAKRLEGYTESPSVVIIGMPDKAALEATIERLNRYKIDHTAYYEPDFDMGLSAIATVPLTTAKQRKAMFIYNTWKESQ